MSHQSVESSLAAVNGGSSATATHHRGFASSSLADLEVTAVSPPTSTLTTGRSLRRKRNSIVSLAVSGGRLLSNRRGSAMPVLQHGEFDVSTKSQQVLGLRNDEWNRVQTKVMTIFEGGKLGPNELFELNEMVRIAIKSEIGSFISEYYKKSLLKRGMEALFNVVEDDGDKQLLDSLSKVWDRFYRETLPTLRAIFYPIQTKGLTMSQITLLGFRDHVLLRTKLKEALLLNDQSDIPQNISQMLLILQNIRELPHPSEDYLQLESLVAMVVSPYLGTRGLYMGGDTPVIKANPPPTVNNNPRHPPIKTVKDKTKRYSLQILSSSQSAHDLCVSRESQPPTSSSGEQAISTATNHHSNTGGRPPRTPIRKPMNITSLETLDEDTQDKAFKFPDLTTRRRTQSNLEIDTNQNYTTC